MRKRGKWMITIQIPSCDSLSQTYYDDVVNAVPLDKLRCSCGQSGCLIRHAYYSRKIKMKSCVIRLRILRLVCKACGRTHAVLLSEMVPYSQIPFQDQKDLIAASETHTSYADILQRNLCIDENNAAYVIRSFRMHWKTRLLRAGIPLGDHLISFCFFLFSRQFMQIKDVPNQLIRIPT